MSFLGFLNLIRHAFDIKPGLSTLTTSQRDIRCLLKQFEICSFSTIGKFADTVGIALVNVLIPTTETVHFYWGRSTSLNSTVSAS